MWILDSETLRIQDVNKSAVDFYGYEKSEFLNMTLADLRAANDSSFIFNNIRDRNDDAFIDLGISSHRKKNGAVVYVHVYARHLIIDGRKVRLAMFVDENDKIVAEKNNKELSEIVNVQKKRLDYVMANIDDVVWGTWADTHELIFTNNACEKVYGYTESEMLADKALFFNSIYIDDRSAFYDSSNILLSTGKAEFEFRVVHKNGSIKYLRGIATVMKGEDGHPDICCGLNIDVTKEKELQLKIEEDEYKLRSLIDNTTDLIWSIDADFKIVTANQPYKDTIFLFTGKIPKAGDSVFADGFSSEITNTWKNYYLRAVNGDAFIAIEKYTAEDESIQYAEVSFSPIFDKNNKIVGVSCFSRNITGRINSGIVDS